MVIGVSSAPLWGLQPWLVAGFATQLGTALAPRGRAASLTVGCAFFTSGGKSPAMAAAMLMATGGSLGGAVANSEV